MVEGTGETVQRKRKVKNNFEKQVVYRKEGRRVYNT